MPKAIYSSAKGLYQTPGSGLTIENGPLVHGTETVLTAGAASVSQQVTILNTGTGVVTLADGAAAGTLKYFICLGSSGTFTLTPDTTTGAYATVAFTTAGQTATLMWDGAGWALIDRMSGAAASASAVVGMPVVAT